MPVALQDSRIDAIVRFLRTQSGPVSAGRLQGQFPAPMPERMLQRLLSDMVAIGILTATGTTRKREYRLRTKPGPFGTVAWFHPDSAIGVAIRDEMPAPAPRVAHPRPASIARHSTSKPKSVPAASVALDSPAKAVAPEPRDKPPTPPAAAATDVGGSKLEARSSAVARSPRVPAKFAALFATSAHQMILARNDRSRTELFLQSDAAIEGLTEPEMKVYMPAALAQLDTLTAESAAALGITAAQYAAWRAAYPAP